mmetsp:Transcript_6897/g.20395  ORF Transcript_6897/g.20395 Transcript_6897/m.20395 type:complete len:201 (+) Transcript_6897:232-834(+)
MHTFATGSYVCQPTHSVRRVQCTMLSSFDVDHSACGTRPTREDRFAISTIVRNCERTAVPKTADPTVTFEPRCEAPPPSSSTSAALGGSATLMQYARRPESASRSRSSAPSGNCSRLPPSCRANEKAGRRAISSGLSSSLGRRHTRELGLSKLSAKHSAGMRETTVSKMLAGSTRQEDAVLIFTGRLEEPAVTTSPQMER